MTPFLGSSYRHRVVSPFHPLTLTEGISSCRRRRRVVVVVSFGVNCEIIA